MSFKFSKSYFGKLLTTILSVAVLGFNFINYNFVFAQTPQEDLGEVRQEQLVNAIEPAVVLIYHTASGTAMVPDFSFNFDDYSFSVNENRKKIKVPIDIKVYGSGFIISPDGHILTNAHVASDALVREKIFQKAAYLAIIKSAYGLSKKEAIKAAEQTKKILDGTTSDQEDEARNKKIREQVLSKIEFKLKNEITVIRPFNKRMVISEAAKNGFIAKLVDANEDFVITHKDLAIIKIEEKKLPALKLSLNPVVVGQKVFVLGFPGAASLDEKDLYQSTFSQGVVSALKKSFNNSFNIIQTDSKISQGSSGGPMVDENGEVVGIIAYESNPDGAAGDNFGFAIESAKVKEILQKNSINNDRDTYSQYYYSGVLSFNNGDYKKSIEQFNLAKNVNNQFVNTKIIDDYLEKANALAVNQKNTNNMANFAISNRDAVFLILYGLLAAFLITGLVFLFKKLKKDEAEIVKIEHLIEEEKGINISGQNSIILDEDKTNNNLK